MNNHKKAQKQQLITFHNPHMKQIRISQTYIKKIQYHQIHRFMLILIYALILKWINFICWVVNNIKICSIRKLGSLWRKLINLIRLVIGNCMRAKFSCLNLVYSIFTKAVKTSSMILWFPTTVTNKFDPYTYKDQRIQNVTITVIKRQTRQ